MNDYLLIDGTQIPVLSELAQVIGLNEAIVVQEVYYWCKVNKREGRKTHQGYYWVYNSYREWTNNHFPWWNEKTVKNIFTRLENRGLLVSGNFNSSKMDRTKWYRVNFPELRKIILASGKICPMDWDGITQPIPDIKPERNENGVFAPQAAENTRLLSSESDDIDIPTFIEWYYEAYLEIFGKQHPRIKRSQTERVISELESFLTDHPEVDMECLQDMAKGFFYGVDSNDWHINHFATTGILQNRYFEIR